MEYVYKSTTGKTVVIENRVVTVEPGLFSRVQIEELDPYLGVSLVRYDNGVAVYEDTATPTSTAKVGLTDVIDVNGVHYALIPVDVNGNAVANIIPRTGFLENLLSLGGNAGELASATDDAAIVQFNGTPGGAKAFYPSLPIYIVPVVLGTTTYSIPLAVSIYVPNVVGVNNPTLSTSEVPKLGQRIVFNTEMNCTFASVFLSSNSSYTLYWDGTEWLTEKSEVLPSSTYAGNPPYALAGAVFSNLPSALGAVGIGPNADASNEGASLLGPGSTLWNYSVVLGLTAIAPNTGIHNLVLSGITTTSSQTKILTIDRATASELNTLVFPPIRGIYDVSVVLIANAGNTTACCRMERAFIVNVTGSGVQSITIPATTGLPTDINTGMTGASVSIDLNATLGSVDVTVTAPSTAMSTRWAAFVTVKSTGGF